MKKKRFLAIFLVLTMLVSLMPMGFAEEAEELVEEPAEVPAEEIVDETPAEEPAEPETPAVPEEELVVEENDSEENLRVVSWTVKFYSTGAAGEAAWHEEYVQDGQKCPLPAGNPVRGGYDFKGWATTAGASVPDVFLEDATTHETVLPTITQNTSYYAVWSPVTVSVAYARIVKPGSDSADPEYLPDSVRPQPETVKYGAGLNVAAFPEVPEFEGYTFHWYEVGNSVPAQLYPIADIATYKVASDFDDVIVVDDTTYSMTLQGQYDVSTITLTMDHGSTASLGGNDTKIVDPQSWFGTEESPLIDLDANTPGIQVPYGTTVPVPNEPWYSVDGIKFDKWTVGGEQYKAKELTADTTFVGNWTNKYTVSFYSGDTEEHQKICGTKDVVYGSEIGTPPAPPTKTGFDFDGWYSVYYSPADTPAADTAFDAKTTVTDDTLVYFAHWTTGNMTVTFLNGNEDLSDKVIAVPYNTSIGAQIPTVPAIAGKTTNSKWYVCDKDGHFLDNQGKVIDLTKEGWKDRLVEVDADTVVKGNIYASAIYDDTHYTVTLSRNGKDAGYPVPTKYADGSDFSDIYKDGEHDYVLYDTEFSLNTFADVPGAMGEGNGWKYLDWVYEGAVNEDGTPATKPATGWPAGQATGWIALAEGDTIRSIVEDHNFQIPDIGDPWFFADWAKCYNVTFTTAANAAAVTDANTVEVVQVLDNAPDKTVVAKTATIAAFEVNNGKYCSGWFTDATPATEFIFDKPVGAYDDDRTNVTRNMVVFADLHEWRTITFVPTDADSNTVYYMDGDTKVTLENNKIRVPDGFSFAEYFDDNKFEILADRKGYDLDAWVNSGSGPALNYAATVTADAKYIASWKSGIVAVTFAEDLTILPYKTVNVPYNTTIPSDEMPEDPSSAHEVFLGWYEVLVKDDGTKYLADKAFDFNNKITEATALCAKWGEAEATIVRVVDEELVTITFTTIADAAAAVQNGDIVSIDKDLTIGNAITFTKDVDVVLEDHTISFTGNGGFTASGAVVTVGSGTVEGGKFVGMFVIDEGTYNSVDFSKVVNPDDGFAVQKGQFNKASADSINAIVDEHGEAALYDSANVILKEVASSGGYYRLTSYKTLTFIYDSESGLLITVPVKVAKGEVTERLDLDPDAEGTQNPEKEGFAFIDWYEKNADGTYKPNAFAFGNALNENTTVYAKWGAVVTFNYLVKEQETDKEFLKVSYVLPLDTVVNIVEPDETITVVPEQTLVPAKLPAVPDANKVFEYWATDTDNWTAYDFSKKVTGNLELFAKYEWAVTFDAKSGGTIKQGAEDKPSPFTVTLEQNQTFATAGIQFPTVLQSADEEANYGVFKAWYIADENGAPTSKEFTANEHVTSDLKVVAVYNNVTNWAVYGVYADAVNRGFTINNSPVPATHTNASIAFSGTDIEHSIELNKLSGKKIGSDTLNGYFIGYQFEAPESINSSNINLWSMQINSSWVPLTSVVDSEKSVNGHYLVNVFEPVDIDTVKSWADNHQVKTFTYKFLETSKTTVPADVDSAANITVTFDPNYVKFGGMVDDTTPIAPAGEKKFEVQEFSVVNYEYKFDVKFYNTDVVDGANPIVWNIEVESGKTVSESVTDHWRTAHPGFNSPLDPPKYADNSNFEFQNWSATIPTALQKFYHSDTSKDPAVYTGTEKVFGPTDVYAFNHEMVKVNLMVGDNAFTVLDSEGTPIPQVLPMWYGSPRDDVQATLTEKGYVNKNNELIGFEGSTFDCWTVTGLADFTDNATFNKDWTLGGFTGEGTKTDTAGVNIANDTFVLSAKFNDRSVTFDNKDHKFVGAAVGVVTIEVGVGKSLNYWAGIEGNDLPVPVVAKDMTYYWTTVTPTDLVAWTWDSVPAEFDMDSAMVKNELALTLYAYPHADNEATVTFAQPVDASQITVLDTLNIEKGKSLDETDYALPVPEYDKDMEDYYWTSVAPDKWTVGVKPAEYDKKSPIDDDLTLYAYVYAVKVEVTFFTKADDTTGTKVAVEIGKAIPTDAYPEVTIPEGMTFAGWSTVAPGTQDYPKMFDTTTKIETAISLWAVFQEAPAFVPTLNLADYTGVRVYIDLPEGADASEYTAEWSYKTYRQEKTDSKKVSELPVGKAGTKYEGMYLVDALRAASTEMSDTVTVKLTKGNEVVKTETFTVKGIADKMIEDGADAPTALVLNALKQYGYYGQKVFHNKEDDLPNIDDAPALVAIPDEYASSDPTTFGAYVTKFEDKLDLNSATKMNLYFTLADGYTANDFTFTVLDKDGKAYTKCNVTGTTKVKVQIEGILSPQLARNFQVVVTLKSDTTKTATWTRSAIACAYTYQQGSNNDVNVPKLMQSLYQYYLASAALFPQFK